MNLTDLVPPLYLCKLIPEVEFQESALYWGTQFNGTIADVFPRECGFCDKFHIVTDCIVSPAPTLQEILEDLPQGVELSRDSEWFCSLDMTNEYYDNTPATAALKVWLKLKGIEA